MLQRLIVAAFVALAVSGCAGMADAMSSLSGVGVVSEEKSTFDGATIVSMSPAFLYREGEWLGVPFKLGAKWSDKAPDFVGLELTYGSDTNAGSLYVNFTGLDINIDGNITSHEAGGMTSHDSSSYNTVSQKIYTQSKNVVVIPLSMLKDMLRAKDCRLRIHSSKGYEDAQFSVERIPGGQGTAIIPMRDFMARVESKLPKRSQ